MPKTGFTWAAFGARGEEKGDINYGISVTAAGLQQGHRDQLGWAAMPLCRHLGLL